MINQTLKLTSQPITTVPSSLALVALYLRVSTEAQEDAGTSLDTQEAAARRYAGEHGLAVAIVLREVWSGLSLERPQLNYLRELAARHSIQAVVAYATDRLSRDPVHLLLLLDEFDKFGIQTHFITEPRDGSIEGQLITFVRGWTGKVEAIKIAERTQRGRRARAQSGKLPTGSRRYGWVYDKETGKRLVNDVEAQVVRDMASWVVKESLSWGGIRARLHERGVLAPEGGDWWGLSTIRRILTDEALIGETFGYRYRSVEPVSGGRPGRRYIRTRREERPRNEWIPLQGSTPPILGREEFAQLQRQLQRNRSLATRARRYDYLLTGFVYCLTCGRRYYGEPGKGKRYYRCAGRRAVSQRCRSPQVGADALERYVVNWFDECWTKPDVLRLILLRGNKPESKAPLQARLQTTLKQLEKLEAERTRLARLYIAGDFDDAVLAAEKKRIAAESSRLIAERESLQQNIDSITSAEIDEATLQQLVEMQAKRWRTMGFEERRQVFSRVDLHVEILPDGRVQMNGLMPVPEIVTTTLDEEFRRGNRPTIPMVGFIPTW